MAAVMYYSVGWGNVCVPVEGVPRACIVRGWPNTQRIVNKRKGLKYKKAGFDIETAIDATVKLLHVYAKDVVVFEPDALPPRVEDEAPTDKLKPVRVLTSPPEAPMLFGTPATFAVHMATDGGCLNQGTPSAISGGGIAVVVIKNNMVVYKDCWGVWIKEAKDVMATNNRAEMRGAIDGLKWVEKLCLVNQCHKFDAKLMLDSKYTIDSILGSGGSVNRDLIDQVHEAFEFTRIAASNIEITKVKGHSGDPLNDAADNAASCAIHTQIAMGA